MHKVAAIILAAGQSQRMGDANKLLLRIDGIPMIRHVVNRYRAAINGPIIVVTGFEAGKVQKALQGVDVQCEFNPEYECGQQTSVACGLTHVPDADLLLIGLGDQPLLRTSDICALIDVHEDENKISIPTMANRRGNPIAVPHALRARLTVNPKRPGCMSFTRDNPDLVTRHTLPAAGFYADVDTPDDYVAVSQRRNLTDEETHEISAPASQENGAHA